MTVKIAGGKVEEIVARRNSKCLPVMKDSHFFLIFVKIEILLQADRNVLLFLLRSLIQLRNLGCVALENFWG